MAGEGRGAVDGRAGFTGGEEGVGGASLSLDLVDADLYLRVLCVNISSS